jgi:hypothetical protein
VAAAAQVEAFLVSPAVAGAAGGCAPPARHNARAHRTQRSPVFLRCCVPAPQAPSAAPLRARTHAHAPRRSATHARSHFAHARAPRPALSGDDDDADADAEEPATKKRKHGGFPLQALSAPMAAFMGAPEARRNEVVSRLWQHIKANSLNVRSRCAACFCVACRCRVCVACVLR